MDGLEEVLGVVHVLAPELDDLGVGARAPTRGAAVPQAHGELDSTFAVEAHLVHAEGALSEEDQRRRGDQFAQLRVRDGRVSTLQAHLPEPVALAQPHREGERAHLEPEGPRVARRCLVEARVLGDEDAREQIGPTGRAARVEARANVSWQVELVVEADQVDQAPLEHRAFPGQVEPGGRHLDQPVAGGVAPGQEACPDPVRGGAEAQVDAGGLDLGG